MRTALWPVAAVLGILLLPGCSGKPPVDDGKDRTDPLRRGAARIVFRLPGDDIGGQEYQTILDAIKAEILSNRLGEIVSSGYGMGTMEIVVSTDRDDSLEAIRQAVGRVYPEANYRIEPTTR